jgi:hypothetical protein
VCLSVCMSVFLLSCFSINVFLCLYVCLSALLSFCLSISLLLLFQSTCLFFFMSIYFSLNFPQSNWKDPDGRLPLVPLPCFLFELPVDCKSNESLSYLSVCLSVCISLSVSLSLLLSQFSPK